MLNSLPFPRSGIVRLQQFSLLHVDGPDAEAFLQGQLTNDVKALPADQACLAGYCTAKGRLLATMLVWRNASGFLLQVPAEISAGLHKRLQMFVLRAKVVIKTVDDQLASFGVFGDLPTDSWPAATTLQPYGVTRQGADMLVRVADADGIRRHLWVTPAPPALIVDSATDNDWALSDIHAGVPQIGKSVQEQFVPQMVNLELLGGVSFKKGCYPGQEIVARTHYLGKQKRRTVLALIEGPAVTPGTEVFVAGDLTQPCGMVVSAALRDVTSGDSDCLVEIKQEYYPDAVVQTSDARRCVWLPMPYPLPEPVAATSQHS